MNSAYFIVLAMSLLTKLVLYAEQRRIGRERTIAWLALTLTAPQLNELKLSAYLNFATMSLIPGMVSTW